MNEKKFDKCLADHKYAAVVQADMADGQRFGVRGTPTFFVNGLQDELSRSCRIPSKPKLDKQKLTKS